MSGSGRRREAGASRVASEAERLLTTARARAASDLHLEPTGDAFTVRLRLDGVLHDVETLPPDLGRSVVARLKLLADLLTYRSDVPQEGRVREEDAHGPGDLRVSTYPTIHGERLVVRFFDRALGTFELENLGFPPAALVELRRAVSATSGVVLLTGPAGSGKTTTLYATLNSLLRRTARRLHIITVEDPVESVLPGVTQTQVNPAVGLTFARALRSLLRQDPEVVMVGEIRDRETAEIVTQAGLTGHLVLSTLHGGDVATVIARLLDMGVEPYVVTSALRAVLAMRLVRTLCEQCRREGPAVGLATRERPLRTFEPQGCGACGDTGYAGRRPIVEFAEITGPLRRLILASADAETLTRQLEAEGMITLVERGLELVEGGVTSLEEMRRVCGGMDVSGPDLSRTP
ncbi:MAG TPA: GspE/PulE family protein [Planctomycetota bacterium]|nr:GspE/PulE family protein [Planctomycetota bacterium]